MSPSVMMRCGCRAQAVRTGTNAPSCPVHLCDEVATAPDLTGRVAQCAYNNPRGQCRSEKPSSLDLAFFEWRGEGSPAAVEHCVCGYHAVAHDPQVTRTYVRGNQQTVVERGECSGFRPRGAWDTDLYYCGCRGWD